MRLSDGEQRRMESRFAQRCAAAGAEAEKQLARQLAALSPDCALLTKWCFASSPLSDWADDNFSLFRACAEHALYLRRHSPLATSPPRSPPIPSHRTANTPSLERRKSAASS